MTYTYADYFKDYYRAVKKAHKHTKMLSTQKLAGGKEPVKGKVKTYKPYVKKHFRAYKYGEELGVGWK